MGIFDVPCALYIIRMICYWGPSWQELDVPLLYFFDYLVIRQVLGLDQPQHQPHTLSQLQRQAQTQGQAQPFLQPQPKPQPQALSKPQPEPQAQAQPKHKPQLVMLPPPTLREGASPVFAEPSHRCVYQPLLLQIPPILRVGAVAPNHRVRNFLVQLSPPTLRAGAAIADSLHPRVIAESLHLLLLLSPPVLRAGVLAVDSSNCRVRQSF